MKAMILAAGRGQRMGSLTEKIPKPLTKVNDIPLIEHNIIRIRDAGITDIVINISWLGYKIKDYLGSGSRLGVNIHFVDEGKEMLGTGGGILNALPVLGLNPFWLINADLYSDFQLDPIKELENGKLAHLILVNNPDHHLKGDFLLSGNLVTPITEYKINDSYTFSGMSIISPKLFDGMKQKVFPLEPVLKKKSREKKISGELYEGLWTDVGSQKRLRLLENSLIK